MSLSSFGKMPTAQKVYTVIRILLGLGFVYFGAMKFIWEWYFEAIGGTVAYVGLEPSAGWGLAAALVELIGGLFLIFGFATRITSLLLVETMIMAIIAYSHGFGLNEGDVVTFSGFVLPGIFFYLSALFLFRGAGPFSLDTQRGMCLLDKMCTQCTKQSCKK